MTSMCAAARLTLNRSSKDVVELWLAPRASAEYTRPQPPLLLGDTCRPPSVATGDWLQETHPRPAPPRPMWIPKSMNSQIPTVCPAYRRVRNPQIRREDCIHCSSPGPALPSSWSFLQPSRDLTNYSCFCALTTSPRKQPSHCNFKFFEPESVDSIFSKSSWGDLMQQTQTFHECLGTPDTGQLCHMHIASKNNNNNGCVEPVLDTAYHLCTDWLIQCPQDPYAIGTTV